MLRLLHQIVENVSPSVFGIRFRYKVGLVPVCPSWTTTEKGDNRNRIPKSEGYTFSTILSMGYPPRTYPSRIPHPLQLYHT
jgi:hypothetical protein